MEALQVLVRVRPFTEEERENEEQNIISTSSFDPKAISVQCTRLHGAARTKLRPSSASGKREEIDDDIPSKFIKNYTLSCKYDRVFGEDTSQKEIFDELVHQVDAVLNGVNCTIFAYGQTGTGKTYSMFGKESVINDDVRLLYDQMPRDHWGLVPRLLQRIFRELGDSSGLQHRQGIVHCSYVQIYREQVHDLMQHPRKRQPLKIRENVQGKFGKRETFVQGLSEYRVSSFEDVVSLIERGNQNRAIRSTEYNKVSSRSHAILQLDIQIEVTQQDGSKIIRHSKFNFVDLAGCEKWNTLRQISEKRSKELMAINNSLSALGNVIQALGERRRRHIPYRDSKLTRLLQDSLGGNTKTALLCTLSPAKGAQEDIVSTLQFADRAKKVLVRVKTNEIVDDSVLLARAQTEIVRLKRKLKNCSCGERSGTNQEPRRLPGNQAGELQGLRTALHAMEKENRRLVLEVVNLKAELGRFTTSVPAVVPGIPPANHKERKRKALRASSPNQRAEEDGKDFEEDREHASGTSPARGFQVEGLGSWEHETKRSLGKSSPNADDFFTSHSVPPPSDIAQALREYLAEANDEDDELVPLRMGQEEKMCLDEIAREEENLSRIQQQRRQLVLLKSSLEGNHSPGKAEHESPFEPSKGRESKSFEMLSEHESRSLERSALTKTVLVPGTEGDQHAVLSQLQDERDPQSSSPQQTPPGTPQLRSVEPAQPGATSGGTQPAHNAPVSSLNPVQRETSRRPFTAPGDTRRGSPTRNSPPTPKAEAPEGREREKAAPEAKLPSALQYSLDDVGRWLEIYQFRTESWYSTLVVDYDPDSEMHRIKYSDGTISWHRLEGKRYRFVDLKAAAEAPPKKVTSPNSREKLRATANTRRQRVKVHSLDNLKITTGRKSKKKSSVVDNAIVDAYLGITKRKCAKQSSLPSVIPVLQPTWVAGQGKLNESGQKSKKAGKVKKYSSRRRSSFTASLTDI